MVVHHMKFTKNPLAAGMLAARWASMAAIVPEVQQGVAEQVSFPILSHYVLMEKQWTSSEYGNTHESHEQMIKALKSEGRTVKRPKMA